MTDHDPNAVDGRRQDDEHPHFRLRSLVRENWYRDVWLILISVGAIVAIVVGADANQDRVNDNKKLIEAIQESRVDAFTTQCNNVNKRNQRASQKLQQAPPRANVDKRIVKGLIDELAPYTPDCAAAANEAVAISPTPTPAP